MLSTPSYFKLKPQLRLAAEYDPSTYIEFELRCNSAASNLRYKTVFNFGMAMTSVIVSMSSPSEPRLAREPMRDRTQPQRKANCRAQPPRLPVTYRPSGVPLTSTEPDETTGAPPRRL